MHLVPPSGVAVVVERALVVEQQMEVVCFVAVAAGPLHLVVLTLGHLEDTEGLQAVVTTAGKTKVQRK